MSKADNNLYEEVKSLFSISDIAFNIFYTIKDRQKLADVNSDTLIIYENRKDMIDDLKKLKKHSFYIDLERQYAKNENSKEYLRFRTINQCKTLDGYRFKTIIFK